MHADELYHIRLVIPGQSGDISQLSQWKNAQEVLGGFAGPSPSEEDEWRSCGEVREDEDEIGEYQLSVPSFP